MTQVCRQCSRINPAEASYCYHDGALLADHSTNGGLVNTGSRPFPSHFVFPNGTTCRNFDQLAMTCQQHWPIAVDVLKQGFLANFLGGLGRADLALAAKEAAKFPDQDRGLDQLLAKLPTKVLEPPQLKVEPSAINLGQMAVGVDRDLELHLANLGMRLLYGSVVSDCKWLTFGEGQGTSQKLFQFGAETIITVHVKGQQLRAGHKPLEGKLIFDSNGGSATVLVRADVPITPFPDGVLAGSVTPRQIAEKAKAAPREAAALFENGAVAGWFAKNGWTYPVQGPSVGGIGGVQQFFEALGLARPPKVELKTTSLSMKGDVGQSLQASLEVFTRDNKVLYAHATTDQIWVDVSKVKLVGRHGVITVAIPSIPNRPGETLEARIFVQGNGNQRFTIPLVVAIGGGTPAGNPFANLDAPLAPIPIPVGKLEPDPVVVVPKATPEQAPAPLPVRAPAPEPVSNNPFAVIPPSITQSGIMAAPLLTLPGSASATLPAQREPAPANGLRRPATQFWKHLSALFLLSAVLIGLMVRDLFQMSAGPVEDDVERTQRLLLQFDLGANTSQSGGFGLLMVDPDTKTADKKLIFSPVGRTNSTVLWVDDPAKTQILGNQKHGKWEHPFKPAGKYKQGKEASFLFLPDKILVTQTVEVTPGVPVEITPEVFARLLDTCVIRYRLENRDSRPHTVAVRALIDTMIGKNDGAPFAIPGVPGLVNTFKDLRDKDVPDFIQAQEYPSLESPGTVVQLNLKLGGRIEAPARVCLTHWPGDNPNFKPNIWDYEIPLRNIDEDSCIVLYWDPVELAPGKSREVGYSYGLGDVTAKGKLGILNPPPIAAGETFTLVALVADAKPGQTATLELPPGFALTPETLETQNVPLTDPGPDAKLRASPVTWRVVSHEPGNYTFTVKTSDGLNHSRRITVRSTGIFQ